jgi:hypothetical protein
MAVQWRPESHCNCLKIIQKVPEQHTGKALNQGTTEKKPHWALHTHTSDSTNVKVQMIEHWK